MATRCGFIALIGAPNVGKSTLINALVGTKVAIVSHKVQTTRALVRGIAIEGGAQLVFVDTPGIFAPKRRLDRAMVTTAWAGAHDADIVVPADRRQARHRRGDRRHPRTARGGAAAASVLVLNKIDLVDKPALLTLAKDLNAARRVRGDLHDLGAHRRRRRRPAGAGSRRMRRKGRGTIRRTRSPMRRCASSRPRSRARSSIERLHQELPYQSTVETDIWKELRDGAVRIEQTIYVERESQRKIVLGKGGATIKAIGAEARREIAVAIEQQVHLFLFVKVREGWGDDPERYREMGLEFPKE